MYLNYYNHLQKYACHRKQASLPSLHSGYHFRLVGFLYPAVIYQILFPNMLRFRILFMRRLVHFVSLQIRSHFFKDSGADPTKHRRVRSEVTLAQVNTGSDPTECGLARSKVITVLRTDVFNGP